MPLWGSPCLLGDLSIFNRPIEDLLCRSEESIADLGGHLSGRDERRGSVVKRYNFNGYRLTRW